RRRDGLDRADLCLRRRLSARAGQKHKHDAEPECHAQQEPHDPNPCTPFPAALVEAAFRAATMAASLEGHVPVSKRMRRIFSSKLNDLCRAWPDAVRRAAQAALFQFGS